MHRCEHKTNRILQEMKVLLIDNLNLRTYLADVSIGCSNPQGKMNLDWMGLYFYRLFERAKYSEMISFG